MWGSCEGDCDQGMRNRARNCSDPEPLNSGADCSGSNSQEEACDTGEPCPSEKWYSLVKVIDFGQHNVYSFFNSTS